jgi:cytolysin (calcineurin-like family phosphatase)
MACFKIACCETACSLAARMAAKAVDGTVSGAVAGFNEGNSLKERLWNAEKRAFWSGLASAGQPLAEQYGDPIARSVDSQYVAPIFARP